MSVLKRLFFVLTLLGLVITIGVSGYVLIEGWSFADAFYMTAITISTVGFREVFPLSLAGKFFTIFLILAGVGTAIYAIGSVLEFLIEGHLTGIMEKRRVKRMMSELKNHCIVCGFGRVGEQVVREFVKTKTPFVVVEKDLEKAAKCREEGFLCLEGDASNDLVLSEAGIDKAKALIAAVDTDADNVFVTLSARQMNPKIFIAARANLEESEEKLRKAGADRVISPTVIGGRRMASLVLKPLVCDYLDIIAHGEGLELQLEEVEIKEGVELGGRTLKEADIRGKTGALILAIRKPTGEFNTSPKADTVIMSQDKLIVLGTPFQLKELQKVLNIS